ncbi:hypothetical protein HJ059_18560 [Vibrio parahaemolyticus]|nr:hypothetical protein [Vibrio parahaemolyticus]MDF4994595.1 hypothetical protein [Vibrio parahaemolyticus]HCH1607416.1 hypothetical protein [Vibrio parahaemolyticus]HCM0850433.1 hypothetical protein [Vibrio parahaemolyticus]
MKNFKNVAALVLLGIAISFTSVCVTKAFVSIDQHEQTIELIKGNIEQLKDLDTKDV